MSSIFIIAEEGKTIAELRLELMQSGFVCSIAPDGSKVIQQIAEQSPDLLLVEVDAPSRIHELSQKFKRERHLPVIALVCPETLDSLGGHWDVDDFLISPYDVRELVLRAKRLLNKTRSRNGEVIRRGDLLIDQVKCEVTLSGRVIMLTFKEYELLKFLASNPDRVFTRETLLNSVWGYDYYGGDRTVDVHIRRLRSKIEDSSHTFIKTVRNIGYQFRTEY